MKKRLIAMCLFMVIVLSILPSALSSGSICFVGVNDSVPMYLSANEAPYYKGNMLYVPYTVFNAGAGGIAVSYNGEKGSLALFTRAKRLVYDLNAGTVTDENQKVSNVDVVYRNGLLFIPASKATGHFGLTATMLTSSGGSPVLRLTDGSQQLDNSTFVRKAETLISIILEQQTANEEVQQNAAGKDEEEAEVTGPATVYIAITGQAVSAQTVDALEELEIRAAFFLTRQQILEQKELVREIYAAGHQIGLTVADGETDYLAALSGANTALDQILFFKSLMALLPEGVQDISQYAVFREWTAQISVEDMLETAETPQLLVCRSADAAFVLQRLRQAGAYTPQLLETTQIPGVSVNKID